jgi:hypothetical protein
MTGTEKPITGTAHTSLDEKLRLIRFRMSKERLRFSEEIRLIPRKLVLLVAALFVIAHVALQIVVAYSQSPWPELSRNLTMLATAGLVTAASIPIAAFLFLVAYINRDAARRGMNSTLWTVLVLILMPAYFVTGFIIYFLLREPLPYNCPQCNAVVSARYNYCPGCKFNLRPACPGCRREVRLDDRYCPHCAQELAEAAHV